MTSFCKANQDDLLGFKIKLYPTEDQKVILNKQIDMFRYVYNWALEVEHNNYNDDKENSHFLRQNEMFDLLRDMRNSEDHKWLKELPLNTCRHAVLSLLKAFMDFFERRNRYPKYKSRKDPTNKFFILRGERVRFFDQYVHIEGFARGDSILCKNHNIPKNVKYYNCMVSFDGYDYWLSLTTEIHEPMIFRMKTSDGLGIDLGLRKLAKLSNGTEYHLPNTDKLEKRRKRQAARVARDIKKRYDLAKQTRAKFEDIPMSNGMIKRAKEFRKTCNRMTNIRRTYIHTMTKQIVDSNPEFVVMETLNVKGMLKNKYLARKISESCFYDIGTQLKYKCKRRDIPFIKAPRNFASTQICSNCGERHKVGTSEIYRCPYCGFVIDRDLNAAINLKNYYSTI